MLDYSIIKDNNRNCSFIQCLIDPEAEVWIELCFKRGFLSLSVLPTIHRIPQYTWYPLSACSVYSRQQPLDPHPESTGCRDAPCPCSFLSIPCPSPCSNIYHSGSALPHLTVSTALPQTQIPPFYNHNSFPRVAIPSSWISKMVNAAASLKTYLQIWSNLSNNLSCIFCQELTSQFSVLFGKSRILEYSRRFCQKEQKEEITSLNFRTLQGWMAKPFKGPWFSHKY